MCACAAWAARNEPRRWVAIDGFPVVVSELVEQVVADDPGARDEVVEPPALGRERDGRLDVRARGDVAADRAAADPLGGLGRGRLVEVRDDDVRALAREPLGGRGADAAGGAGDERGLALEARSSDHPRDELRDADRLVAALALDRRERHGLLAAGHLLDRLHREGRRGSASPTGRARGSAPC